MRPPNGFEIGHWSDPAALTGCTVVLCPDGAHAAGSVRGGAPATRETDLLGAARLVQEVHALLLTGGSAFGLEAAGGVMRYLAEGRSGFPAPAGPVPIVPAAALYDLALGRAEWPGIEAGARACEAADGGDVPEGNVGAGCGASVGKVRGMGAAMKTGLGAARIDLAAGGCVAAIAVANGFGEIRDADSGALLAGVRGGSGRPEPCEPMILAAPAGADEAVFGNTTLVCVMTDLVMERPALQRVAEQAHDALGRLVRPCHTLYDGDSIFVLSSGRSGKPGDPLRAGVAAVEAVSRALQRAATESASAGGLPSWSELLPPAGNLGGSGEG